MLKNALGLFVVTIFVFLIFLPSYTKMQDLKQTNSEYAAEMRRLKEQRAKLVDERRRLEEDPEYLEKVAREKMGLIREGEVVYQILPANQVQAPAP